MVDRRPEQIRSLGFGAALTAAVSGLFLLAWFDLREEAVRDHLRLKAESVLETVYREGGREAARDVTDAAWGLCLRSSERALNLGSLALAFVLAGNTLGAPNGGRRRLCRQIGLLLFGAGAMFVPSRDLIAGFAAPGLGSTAIALERVEWLLMAGLLAMGLGILLTLLSLRPTAQPQDDRLAHLEAVSNTQGSQP